MIIFQASKGLAFFSTLMLSRHLFHKAEVYTLGITLDLYRMPQGQSVNLVPGSRTNWTTHPHKLTFDLKLLLHFVQCDP